MSTSSPWSHRTWGWGVQGLPLLLALLCPVLAWLLPADAVWGQAGAAGLWSAPPWLCLAQVPWSLVAGLAARRVFLPVGLGLLGVVGAGRPLPAPAPAPADALRILVANVNSFPPDHTDDHVVEEQLASLDADVVVVIERRPVQLPGYVRVADNFHAPMERVSHASAVFCRRGLSCAAHVTPEFGSQTMTMPLALVRVRGLCLMGLHGPPPAPFDPTGIEPHVMRIADHLTDGRLARAWGPCAEGDVAVVAGDLNQVRGSPYHRRLVEGGLVDHVAPYGLFAASWPAGGGWPDLPFFRLDQVLAGPVQVGGLSQHRFDGADHLAWRFWVLP